MNKTKVLIVDDSAFARQSIRTLIETNQEFEVVGIARNGEEAVEKVVSLKPDVITMDVVMQKMSGIDTLKHIMSQNPKPVVMVSDYVLKGTKYTSEAFQYGAVDCFLKSDLLGGNANRNSILSFFEKLKAKGKANIEEMPSVAIDLSVKKTVSVNRTVKREIDMVFIGCSTGGPNALRELLPKLPASFKLPILVAQHMPKGFTTSLAKSFKQICKLPVKEVEHGEVVRNGIIYIAPSGYQTTIHKRGKDNIFHIEDNIEYGAAYSPAVDISLHTLVSVYKDKLLTVILTGMGHDGLEGCKEAKSSGGYVITQSKETCIVYGMPRSVDEAGLSDEKVSLSDIYMRILSITKQN